MGVAKSKVLAENVLAACQSAENSGKTILDDKSLWLNEDICEAAKEIYQYIPKSIRGPSRQSTIKKAVMRSADRLSIPPIVQEVQDKQEELFPSGQSDGSVKNLPSPTTLADYYKLVVQLEKQQDLDKIRLRLLYVAFYRLKQDQQPGSLYENYDSEPIAQAIFETCSISDSLDFIKAKVRKWIGFGERYSLLAADLEGLGVLYILPDLGGETLWNKELPKTADHKHRISIIKTLRKLEIGQEARKRGLHTSGNAEVEHIFMALKKSLPQNTQSEPHLSPAQPGGDQSGISLDTSSSVQIRQTRKRKRQRHQPPDTISRSSSGSNPKSARPNQNSVSHTHTCTPMTSPRNDCQSTLNKEGNARHQHEAPSQPMVANYSLESPGHQRPQADLSSGSDKSLNRRNSFPPQVLDDTSKDVPGEVLSPPAEGLNAASVQSEKQQRLPDPVLSFNPSDYFENIQATPQNNDQIFYSTWSTDAGSYFNPSASLESLPTTYQQNDIRDIHSEETQSLPLLSPRFNPSGYLENLPQIHQGSITFDNQEPTTIQAPCFNLPASLEGPPAASQQDAMLDMQPQEIQSFDPLTLRFNPSGYLENLPRISQNPIAFDNTEPSSIHHPCFNPSASLERLPGTVRNYIPPLPNQTQPYNSSKTQFRPSGSSECFWDRSTSLSFDFLLCNNRQYQYAQRA